MQAVAANLKSTSVLETIINDVKYVKEHIGRKGAFLGSFDLNMPETAEETFLDRTGMCVEHSVLLAALAREQGIPALLRGGIYHGCGHVWVEIPYTTEEGLNFLVVDGINPYIGPDTDEYVHSYETDISLITVADSLALMDNVEHFDSPIKSICYKPTTTIDEILKNPQNYYGEISQWVKDAKVLEPAPMDKYLFPISNAIADGSIAGISYLISPCKKTLKGGLAAIGLGILAGPLGTAITGNPLFGKLAAALFGFTPRRKERRNK
jgi:hypothetical protein